MGVEDPRVAELVAKGKSIVATWYFADKDGLGRN